MSALMERLKRTPILLADGAWGTWFMDQMLDLALEPADVLNLRRPQLVAKLAQAYAEYADILSTNTFGANRIRLAAYRLARKRHKITQRGVAIARKAAGTPKSSHRPVLVAGSMGPARGPDASAVDDAELFDVFQEQAASLAEAGVHFLLVETMTSVSEASIAVRAARTATRLEVVCSFAFREVSPGVFQTWAGDSVEDALGAALDAGAAVVGANCIPATASLAPLVEIMRRAARTAPLLLKPNAGPPTGGIPFDGIAHTFVARLRANVRALWHDLETWDDPWNDPYACDYPNPICAAPWDAVLDALGTGVIGGCCGTGPLDIAHLRQVLDRRADIR